MLTGWKDITEYTGRSRGTLVKLTKNEGFPIQTIVGKPTLTRQSVDVWFKGRAEIGESAYNSMTESEIRDAIMVF